MEDNLKLKKYYQKTERLAKTNVLKIEKKYANTELTNLNKYIDEDVSDKKIKNIKDILKSINFMFEKTKLVGNKMLDTLEFVREKAKDYNAIELYEIEHEFQEFMDNRERVLTIYDILEEIKELYLAVINSEDFKNRKFTINMCQNLAKSSELFREISFLLRECKKFRVRHAMMCRSCNDKYNKIHEISDLQIREQNDIIDEVISEYEKYIILFYKFIGIEIQKDLIENRNPTNINNAIPYIIEFVYNYIM